MNGAAFLQAVKAAILVRVASVAGSAPREAGAWMLVSGDAIYGTIGGGALEYRAMSAARDMLAQGGAAQRLDVALGPEIGQCCGGRVSLELSQADAKAVQALEAQQPEVWIFGGGNVGAALLRVLEAGGIAKVQLIDERAGFPGEVWAAPEAAVARAEPGAAYVVTTHSHASDFLIAAAALKRADAGYVGMIGSASKRAQFESWLRTLEPEVSANRLLCPMGAGGLGDKRPEVIALHVAAEVMEALG